MNQPNMREGSSRSSARGAVASKSQETAQRIESGVAERVERARSQADDAKEQTAERIRRVATQLRSMGESLRGDDAVAANLADRASRGVESVAAYVSTTDARAIISDTEQLARQRPALFFGGAFILGLAAGRFLKSSRPEGYRGGYAGDRQRFDHRERGGSYEERSSAYGARAGESAANGWAAPDGSATERASRGGSSQDRFRQNYDAAFGRDAGTSREAAEAGAAETTGGGPSLGSGAGARRGNSVTSSEPNGVIDPTKGSGS